ncbi:Uncharacterized protein FKW44_023167 [Caligus rogercresseyi]|uniref:Uncharacterized protein n=1 Tax=Caligus rogercresseyi TaxID=217165 RepID=A0A7T8JUX7_CALRO|nr:Uncharacterized protein FKW44_023167 [Caligus rogercresseyi]
MVKKLKDEGQDLGRKPGSVGTTRKDGGVPGRPLGPPLRPPPSHHEEAGHNLGVSKDTIRNAVSGLGPVSYGSKETSHQGQEASHLDEAQRVPQLPDCNTLDYGIWGVVERKACSIPHASVDSLKAPVEKEWAEMSVDFIVKTCKAFRPRLRPC